MLTEAIGLASVTVGTTNKPATRSTSPHKSLSCTTMKTTFAALAFFLTSAISSALDIPDDDIPLFMVADVLYAPGYLETLTEQELKGDFSRKYFEGHKGVLREVFAKDVGNMNSETRFAYKDPRNVSGGGDYLTAGYNGHLYDVTKIPAIEQDKWFLDAMGIWVDIKCSDPPIKHVDLPHPEWPGVAEVYFQSGMIDTSFRQADIQVIGFKDKTEMPFFDGPEGRFILGVNLRIVHFDENGPTDIDGDGKLDIAVVRAARASGESCIMPLIRLFRRTKSTSTLASNGLLTRNLKELVTLSRDAVARTFPQLRSMSWDTPSRSITSERLLLSTERSSPLRNQS